MTGPLTTTPVTYHEAVTRSLVHAHRAEEHEKELRAGGLTHGHRTGLQAKLEQQIGLSRMWSGLAAVLPYTEQP
jgi:hypothetical protein